MPTLSQQETAIRAAAYKGFYFIASTDPTVNDDRNKSFIFGSRWLNTVSQEEFVCLSNNPSAAVWLSTTSGGGGSGIEPHIATSNPTVNDDSGDGYVVGQLWLNTALDECFIASSVTLGAAVWVELTGGGTGGGVTVTTSTAVPTINDDISTGIAVGDLWVRTSTDTVYVCADNTDGAAVWVEIGASTGGSNAHIAAVDPTVNDDSGDGYTVGQIWVNTTTDAIFVAADITIGAAVWVDVSATGAGGGGIASTKEETIGAIAIASARSGIALTPQFLYDGFADGCLDTDGVNTGTTTYVINNGAFVNQAAPAEVRSSGTASASTTYGDGYEAAQAVDVSTSTRWSAADTGDTWFKIDFGVGNTKHIVSIEIKRSLYDGTWTTPVVESSADNSTWTTEYTHTTMTASPADNALVTMSFTPSGAYRYWRVRATVSIALATWNDFKIYEGINVTSPVYESLSRAMPYRPVKATVVIAANISSLTLNTTFVAKYSSNGGTDYETVSLTELATAPYGSGAKIYIGTITTVDRGTQAVRIKIEGGSVLHEIYGVAVIGHPEVTASGSTVSVDDLAVDLVVSNLQQAAVTQQLLRGDILVGADLTGLLGGADTTFVCIDGSYRSSGFSVPGGTNVLSGATLTLSSGGTTTSATNNNTGDYSQINAAVPVWWKNDFGVGVTKNITKIRINQFYDANNSISGFKLQGSNDDAVWTDVYVGTMTNVHNTYVDFTFTPLVATAFRYYRLYVTSRAAAQTSSTLFELQYYESTYVGATDPILTSVSHVLPDEPAKAVVAMVASLDTFTLNSTLVLSISNNGGTNYDAVTLVDRGSLLPYISPYKVYTAVITLTDRNSQTMRIKVQGTGTAECVIKAIAVQYLK